MPTNVNAIIRKLPAARRRKIQARAAQLIKIEMTRQELRQAQRQTQVQVARTLGISQDSVSRLEQRADVLISTLRNYVEALGGHLSIVAEFPHCPPVKLSGIAEEAPVTSSMARRTKRKKAYA